MTVSTRSTVTRRGAVATAGLLAVLLAGCGSSSSVTAGAAPTPVSSAAVPATTSAAPAPTDTGRPSTGPTAAPSPTPPAGPAAAGSYIDQATYDADPAVYAARGPVVLFFHADWCPKCRETDANLTADPASLPADLTVVKVDFDSATDLRQRYGVTVQHTFVEIGADGSATKKWTGTFTGAEIAAQVR